MAEAGQTAPRLLLDECIWEHLAAKLQQDGYDVVHAASTPIKGEQDSIVLASATEQGRVLLTANKRDFAVLAQNWAFENREHCGILLTVQLGPGNEIVRRVRNFLIRETAESIRNMTRDLSDYRN